MYPMDEKKRSKGLEGKLRLMCDANPMSFIDEQADGASNTGQKRIMKHKPGELHQRIPVEWSE